MVGLTGLCTEDKRQLECVPFFTVSRCIFFILFLVSWSRGKGKEFVEVLNSALSRYRTVVLLN